MRQIISGETPSKIFKKTKIFLNYNSDIFYKKNKKDYNLIKNKNILHQSGEILKNNLENFLSIRDNSKIDSHLKAILTNECYRCEKLYPLLGEAFLSFFFKNKKINKNHFFLNKKNLENLIKKEKNEALKKIIKLFIENFSVEYFVKIKRSNTSDVVLEKTDKIIIKNEFDFDFFSLSENSYYDYNFCIIDGFIDSVSEIHHLLQKSSENKNESYILFCYGISQEVKKTLMLNNKKRLTRVFPISFKYSEENLNLLNDIALTHKSDIISAEKGQTISQAVSRKLKKGKHLIVDKNSKTLSFSPLVEREEISNQINILNKKIEKLTFDDLNREILLKRVRSLSNKTLTLFLPKSLYDSKTFINKLNYYFFLFSNTHLSMVNFKLNNENYIFPKIYLEYAFKKSQSTKNIFKNINVIIEEIKNGRS